VDWATEGALGMALKALGDWLSSAQHTNTAFDHTEATYTVPILFLFYFYFYSTR